MKEHTIYKSYLFWTLEEEQEQKEVIKQMFIEDAEESGEVLDLSEERINQRFWDDLSWFYDDEKRNLNKQLPNNVIAIADVGLWDGRRKGGKVLETNLNEVLYFGDCDDLSVTYDRYNVHSVMAHHDGRHYVTYRMVKEGYDAEEILDKYIYEGKDIMRYTKSLVPFVKQAYGF